VNQVFGELAGGEVVAQLPAIAAQHEEGAVAMARIGEAHDFEGTLCSAVPPICCHLSDTRIRWPFFSAMASTS
jgi:hypothetical protein